MHKLITLVVLILGLASIGAIRGYAAEGSVTGAVPLRIVALGDSDTTGEGDPTRLGWVGRYARLLRTKLGLQVTVTNLARNGQTSSQLVADVRSDPTTRQALKEAHIVLLGSGGADLGAGDMRMEAGTCKAEACWAGDLRAFGRNFDKAVALVRKLRGSNATVLRAITLPNVVPGAEDVVPPFITGSIGVYQTRTLRKLTCAAMAKHRGRCVEALRAFNGPAGTQDAYARGLLDKVHCCYPNAKGQQLMAELVFKTGLKPLR